MPAVGQVLAICLQESRQPSILTAWRAAGRAFTRASRVRVLHGPPSKALRKGSLHCYSPATQSDRLRLERFGESSRYSGGRHAIIIVVFWQHPDTGAILPGKKGLALSVDRFAGAARGAQRGDTRGQSDMTSRSMKRGLIERGR